MAKIIISPVTAGVHSFKRNASMKPVMLFSATVSVEHPVLFVRKLTKWMPQGFWCGGQPVFLGGLPENLLINLYLNRLRLLLIIKNTFN